MPRTVRRSLHVLTTALRAVNHTPAKVSYWDTHLKCVFANDAYRDWFGKEPAKIDGRVMKDVMGSLYDESLPHVEAALRGEKRTFERRIVLPDGSVRDAVVTYTPDILQGVTRGFSVTVVDITLLKRREAALAKSIREVIQILEKTKASFRSKELGVLRQKLQQVLDSEQTS